MSHERQSQCEWTPTPRRIIAAALVAASILLVLESWARMSGHAPSVNDDPRLWQLALGRLASPSPQKLAIVGASRSAYGLDLDVLDACTDQTAVQLSIVGGGVRPLVHQLQRSEAHVATVLISLAGPSLEDGGELHARHYLPGPVTGREPADRLDRWLVAHIERHVALMRPELALGSIYGSLRTTGQWPTPDRRVTDLRRSIDAPRAWVEDHAHPSLDIGYGEGQFVPRRWALHPGEWAWRTKLDRLLLDVVAWVDAGVEVFVLRMPSSGIVWDIEQFAYPRSSFWDVVERECRSIGCGTIHFEDWPELGEVDLTDGSHIDSDQRPGFTRALCGVLDQLRVDGARVAADESPRRALISRPTVEPRARPCELNHRPRVTFRPERSPSGATSSMRRKW